MNTINPSLYGTDGVLHVADLETIQGALRTKGEDLVIALLAGLDISHSQIDEFLMEHTTQVGATGINTERRGIAEFSLGLQRPLQTEDANMLADRLSTLLRVSEEMATRLIVLDQHGAVAFNAIAEKIGS